MEGDKIEIIKNAKGNEVLFCPSRGGIITSLKFKGREVLYFDEETFHDKDKSIRGGIPILFPNAGDLITNKQFPELKRHGFARNLEWKDEEVNEGFKETLISNEEIEKIYNYKFILSISGFFEQDGSFTFVQIVENREEREDMPISMGLHPYFKVPDSEKKNIKFNFEGGREIEEKIDIWQNGGTLYIDNPRINNPDSKLEIVIPDLGTIIMSPSVEYEKIWVWSEAGKDFICIEPVMKSLNGLLDDPKWIKPQSKFMASISIGLI